MTSGYSNLEISVILNQIKAFDHKEVNMSEAVKEITEIPKRIFE
jgi:hypothetical protein